MLCVGCYFFNVWDKPFYIATRSGIEPTLFSVDDQNMYAILFCNRQHFSNICLVLIVFYPSITRQYCPFYSILLLVAQFYIVGGCLVIFSAAKNCRRMVEVTSPFLKKCPASKNRIQFLVK